MSKTILALFTIIAFSFGIGGAAQSPNKTPQRAVVVSSRNFATAIHSAKNNSVFMTPPFICGSSSGSNSLIHSVCGVVGITANDPGFLAADIILPVGMGFPGNPFTIQLSNNNAFGWVPETCVWTGQTVTPTEFVVYAGLNTCTSLPAIFAYMLSGPMP